MDTDWLNASASDHKKEGLEWVKKAENKFWFAKQNMTAADEAMVQVNETKGVLPKRTYKKADDWYKLVKEDFDLIKTKMWFVNEKKKTFQSSGGSASDMRKAKNNAKSDYNYIEKHEKQLKNKKDRLEGERSFLGKLATAAKKVALAPARALYLTAVSLNIANLATIFKLVKQRKPEGYKSILFKFKAMAGKEEKFDKAVEKGYKKKPIGAKPMKVNLDNNFTGYNYAEGDKTLKIPNALGSTVAGILWFTAPTPPDPASKAALTTQTALIGSSISGITSIINNLNISLGKDEDSEPELDPDALTQEDKDKVAGELDDNKEDNAIPTWVWYVGGSVLVVGAAIGIYYAVKSKSKNK